MCGHNDPAATDKPWYHRSLERVQECPQLQDFQSHIPSKVQSSAFVGWIIWERTHCNPFRSLRRGPLWRLRYCPLMCVLWGPSGLLWEHNQMRGEVSLRTTIHRHGTCKKIIYIKKGHNMIVIPSDAWWIVTLFKWIVFFDAIMNLLISIQT